MGSLHNMLQSGQRRGRRQAGFSLVELVIVIAIIGILAAIAIPALVSSYPDYQLKEAARNMVSNFQKAKLEAVKRNAWVTVTFKLPGVPNVPDFDYVIFVDSDADHTFSAGDTVLVQENFSRYGGGVRVLTDAEAAPDVSNSFEVNAATNLPCFTFTPRGLPKNSLNRRTSGIVRLTNRKGAQVTQRNVGLNAVGSLTITR